MLISNKYLTNIYMRKNSFSGGRRKRRTMKHKRKKHHKRRTHHKKRRTKHRGGYSGAGNVILTPATFLPENAYPPNGPVNVPPGITKVATKGGEQQFYYAKNNKVIGAPKSTNPPKQSGGKRRKSKRKHKKRKHKRRTRRRKRSRKRRRRRGHRGGGLSDVVESIPGGTDVRDVYYKAGNLVGSLYSQYAGYGPTNQPPMTNYTSGQPINDPVQMTAGDIPMNAYIQDGSAQAAKFTASYK